jgi:hypothetical protein
VSVVVEAPAAAVVAVVVVAEGARTRSSGMYCSLRIQISRVVPWPIRLVGLNSSYRKDIVLIRASICM